MSNDSCAPENYTSVRAVTIALNIQRRHGINTQKDRLELAPGVSALRGAKISPALAEMKIEDSYIESDNTATQIKTSLHDLINLR